MREGATNQGLFCFCVTSIKIVIGGRLLVTVGQSTRAVCVTVCVTDTGAVSLAVDGVSDGSDGGDGVLQALHLGFMSVL